MTGGVQAEQLFNWTKQNSRNTIGTRGSKLLQLPFEESWRTWTNSQLLSELVYFQLCCAMREKEKVFVMEAAAYPFVRKIIIHGKGSYVLVLRLFSVEHILQAIEQSDLPIIVIAEAFRTVHH